MTRALLALGAVACAALACATTSGAPSEGLLVVRDVDGDAELFRAQATFGVRSAREGRAERVVAVPGLGEIRTGSSDAAHDACRFVWSRDGLDELTLYDLAQGSCGALDAARARMCFAGARFVASSKSGAHPRELLVDGCADENDLLWSKLDGASPATVGPTSYRQRCRPLPQKPGCSLTYVKKEALQVASNDTGVDGFALAYDGERWRACFLEKESGAYSLRLTLEDSCGARDEVTLAGDSAELDD